MHYALAAWPALSASLTMQWGIHSAATCSTRPEQPDGTPLLGAEAWQPQSAHPPAGCRASLLVGLVP